MSKNELYNFEAVYGVEDYHLSTKYYPSGAPLHVRIDRGAHHFSLMTLDEHPSRARRRLKVQALKSLQEVEDEALGILNSTRDAIQCR